MKKRAYKQNCALALSSDLLGERWTLLILRELLIQPCRFKELNLYLQGMGTNLLTNRLKELELDGLIQRQDPENKRSAYQLTSSGLALEPIVLLLILWGYEHGEYQDEFLHFDHWDLLAMKAFFNPAKGSKPLSVQFNSDSLQAWVDVSDQGFQYGLGENTDADAIIDSSISEFQQALKTEQYAKDKIINAFVQWFEIPQMRD